MSRPLDHRQSNRPPLLRNQAKGPVSSSAKVLTQPRSRRYATALGALDASATLTPVETAALIDDIHREFNDTWAAVPLGLVSCCFLGPPFEVHTLDPGGAIIEHYAVGRALPSGLERARQLARADTYLAIEVYPDRMVCVRADGSVITLEG